MKRVGHLFEKVIEFENLVCAAKRTVRGKKHHAPAAIFLLDLEKEAIALQEELSSGSYRPGPYFEFEVREPKVRRICSSIVRDRAVHHAICNVIGPYFERRLIHDTYACRVGKGSHAAVRRCQAFVRRYPYFLKCDIAKYFESVDHATLKALLARIFKDPRLLELLNQIINHQAPGAPSGKGLPIGNLTSQHFANLYLGELDHFVQGELRPRAYLRYMDDFILFHESKDDLHKALAQIRTFAENVLRLSLKDKATIIAPVSGGVPYLGFRIFPGLIRLQRANLVRLRKKIAARERDYTRGYISEEDLLRSMNSMIAHASHGNITALMRKEITRSLKMA